MLRHTFQHLRGVTSKREALLWASGVLDWDAFRRAGHPQASLFEDKSQDLEFPELDESERAIIVRDAEHFLHRLDKREHFRISLAFPDDTLFLDIETTGLSRYYDQITVIGWSLGSEYGFFVKGQDDAALNRACAKAKVIVTFNGTLFDIPFVKHELPDLELPAVHVDLRFLAKRVGLTGGQKQIERELGIARDAEVASVAGEAAPILWNEYTRGDLQALRLLLEYNVADIWGMKRILDVCVQRLLREYGFPLDRLPQPSFGERASEVHVEAVVATIAACLVPWPKTEARKIRLEDLVYVDRYPRLKVVGIDLTGSEVRPSGWCLLDGREVETARLGGDDEIVARTVREHPHLISIDSPLTLPEGRLSVDDADPGRHIYGIMRYSERVLKKRGVNVYPALIPSMQRLTGRGMALAKRFRSMGFPVIESYPGAAQDIMGIPRKRKGLEYLEQGLAQFGVSGPFITQQVSHDELDAITSAVVGAFFWAGQVERLGADPLAEEALMIPDLRVDALERRSRLIVGFSGALGAGKTTAARYLEGRGFQYCRYSQVIARLVAAAKPEFNRTDLQIEGERVHRELGQRWLGKELLRPVYQQPFLVIDGLRFPDDHAYLTEIYGAQFLHIHIVANRNLRQQRYESRESLSFPEADEHPVEKRSVELEVFARDIVENNGEMEVFLGAIDKLIQRTWSN